MTVSSDQLSLPLFEDAGESDERPSSTRRGKPTPRAPVVAGCSQARSGETAASLEPTADSTAALLTTNEAAKRLHVHPRTVQRLVERGQLEAVRLGTAVRFDPLDLENLTGRLKQGARATGVTPAGALLPGRAAAASFTQRLRSQRHEHRAA